MSGDPGASLAHSETAYRDPLNITLVTSKAGPWKVAVRLLVSRLKLPPCASALVTATVSPPVRDFHPSVVWLSNVLLAPAVLPGAPAGGATWVMLTASM